MVFRHVALADEITSARKPEATLFASSSQAGGQPRVVSIDKQSKDEVQE